MATIAEMGTKTISAHSPRLRLLSGFVLAIATLFSVDTVDTFIETGI